MEYGAHLPLVDLDGRGWGPQSLTTYTVAARELGFRVIAANDHLVFARPWLDGLVALSSVVGVSGDLTLATTAALPVVRGPAVLAKAAAALHLLSGGRLALGVAPGSSRLDYEAAGVSFEERWPRFDEAVRVLRGHLKDGQPEVHGRFYSTSPGLEPRPDPDDGPPLWIGSWGSNAGLRRVARYGDAWLASAYNTTPLDVSAARARLASIVAGSVRPGPHLPCVLATMWTFVTDDPRARDDQLARTATLLRRTPEDLAARLLIGPPEHCARVLSEYAAAGVDTVLVWPLAEPVHQLERFMREVAPLVRPVS